MAELRINQTPLYALSPYLFMQFAEPLGTADSSIDAAWDFAKDCWQPKALEMVRRLAPPMLRWGGCFASYYHWREAVGPMAERIPMHNICWDGVFLNHVGTAELVELAKVANAELLFCVNFESEGSEHWGHATPGDDRRGNAAEAADWVRYCNDPDNALRKKHGHEAPYNIRYWQIGNETGYDEGNFNRFQNAAKAPEFIKAMRAADPRLKLIVWGDGPNQEWQQRYKAGLNSDWAESICEAVGDTAEMVAFHNHFGLGEKYHALHELNYLKDADLTWQKIMEATGDFEDRIRYMEQSVAPYGRKLAMTESHFVLAGRHRGDLLSTWYAGVAYARCANILQRHGNVMEIATLADFMGNRWQNNAIMLPTPMWTADPAYFLPAGTIMGLYSHHIGQQALAVQAPDGVDAAASRTGNTVFLHLVNLDRTTAKRIDFNVFGTDKTPSRILQICADPTDTVYDTCPDIFEPKDVAPSGTSYTLPAASVAVVEFQI